MVSHPLILLGFPEIRKNIQTKRNFSIKLLEEFSSSYSISCLSRIVKITTHYDKCPQCIYITIILFSMRRIKNFFIFVPVNLSKYVCLLNIYIYMYINLLVQNSFSVFLEYFVLLVFCLMMINL